jgi:hypothetical protein
VVSQNTVRSIPGHNLGDVDLSLSGSSEKSEDATGEDELNVFDKHRIDLGQNSFGDGDDSAAGDGRKPGRSRGRRLIRKRHPPM